MHGMGHELDTWPFLDASHACVAPSALEHWTSMMHQYGYGIGYDTGTGTVAFFKKPRVQYVGVRRLIN